MGYYSQMDAETLDAIIEHVCANGGATVAIDTRAVIEPPDNSFIVAVGEPYAWQVESKFNWFDSATIDALRQFLNHAEVWAADLSTLMPLYVGLWATDGILHLDIVQITTDRELALQAGRERNQIAIFDTATGEDIQVDGSATVNDNHDWFNTYLT